MFKGWKTVILAAAMIIVGGLQTVHWIDITHNPETAGFIMTGLGLLVGWLRSQTDTTWFTDTSPAPTPKILTPEQHDAAKIALDNAVVVRK